MQQYPRYAIYAVPPAESAIYRFGAELLGYDSYSGADIPFANGIETDIENWRSLTADPRKYGFHATLKAPISLAAGQAEGALVEAFRAFARTPRTIPTIKPVVRALGSFIAIVPDAPSPALQALAADSVTDFNDFRAPLTPEDRNRRNISALTEREIAHLDRWGYPYVFEDFRFHMTLTRSISDDARRDAVLKILQRRFTALDLHTLAIRHVALLRQDDANSRFVVLSHQELASSGAQ